LQLLGTGYEFTEGPAADAEGNVFFTDQPNDRIVRWDAREGTFSDWLKPAGRSNGTYFRADGHLITCADELNQLWAIAPDKSVKVLVEKFDGKLLNGPNDLWIHPGGGIYFTDPLYPRSYWQRDPAPQQDGPCVYYLPADAAAPVRAADGFEQPNGIVGTPDGKLLYVSDIRAGKTYAYAIEPDGRLGAKTLFCELGSDGMTLDERGNVYLTGQGVTVFDAQGRKIEHIEIAEGWTANVTFGGVDRRLLFITSSKSVYGLPMQVRGAAPPPKDVAP
jgi:gluconolactonase